MRIHLLIIVLLFALIIGGIMAVYGNRQSPLPMKEEKTAMKIESPAFAHEQSIPAQYTCDDNNGVPELFISGVPENAKSLALIVDDPDAPQGTRVHWTMWNIDPKTTKIAAGKTPQGAVEGMTSFGKPGYGGPCPPSGTHRYFFKLYALDTMLELEPSADKEELEEAMIGNVLAHTELIGLYSRK